MRDLITNPEEEDVEESSPLVFLSYASPDRDRVTPYYDFLRARGINAWIDIKELKPGETWDFEIQKALSKASIIIVFLSNMSIDRRGYVQREIRIALDYAKEKVLGDIYTIPIMLDDMAIPHQFKDIHCAKESDSNCKEDVIESIKRQLSIKIEKVTSAQDAAGVWWTFSRIMDEWDGLPGYRTEMAVPSFSSERFVGLDQVSSMIRGEILKLVMQNRMCKFEQSTNEYDFGQERYFRTSTVDAACTPVVKGKILSVPFAVHTYYPGAAHGNMGFRVFNFFLDPVILIEDIRYIFREDQTLSALDTIRNEIRRILLSPNVEAEGDSYSRDEGWVHSGTEGWDNFQQFVFREDGIDFLFPPYAVACYAEGPQFVLVKYELIMDKLKPHVRSALGGYFLK